MFRGSAHELKDNTSCNRHEEGRHRELRQATAAKTSPKKWIRAVSNFIALIPTPLMCQMLAIFQELNSKGLYLSSEKQNENHCLVFTPVHKTWNYEVSRHSRAVTARKNTKKRDVRAKLLFCQCKPIASLPFSLTSPLPLLNLPILDSDHTRKQVGGSSEALTTRIDNMLIGIEHALTICKLIQIGWRLRNMHCCSHS